VFSAVKYMKLFAACCAKDIVLQNFARLKNRVTREVKIFLPFSSALWKKLQCVTMACLWQC